MRRAGSPLAGEATFLDHRFANPTHSPHLPSFPRDLDYKPDSPPPSSGANARHATTSRHKLLMPICNQLEHTSIIRASSRQLSLINHRLVAHDEMPTLAQHDSARSSELHPPRPIPNQQRDLHLPLK
jgi:hypothetical protein